MNGCQCDSAGHCKVFDRDMDQSDFDTCKSAVHFLRVESYLKWSKEKRLKLGPVAPCVYLDGPSIDEFGNQRVRKTCGCGGRRSTEPLVVCLHPSHADPMPDDCISRCTNFHPL